MELTKLSNEELFSILKLNLNDIKNDRVDPNYLQTLAANCLEIVDTICMR